MQTLIATKLFMEEVNSMRKVIKETLISLLEKHNVKRIDCFPIGNTPAVCCINNATFTLDTIILNKYSNCTDIKFEISNSNVNANNYIYIEDVGIEQLLYIYDWVHANEKKIFAEDE